MPASIQIESFSKELGPLSHVHESGHTFERGPHGSDGSAISGTVLDIGEDTGALVIYADDHTVGSEIEICPSGLVAKREHNVVRARRTQSGLVYAAVFPALRQGRYTVLTVDLQPSHEVSVVGGRVTEVDCRSRGRA